MNYPSSFSSVYKSLKKKSKFTSHPPFIIFKIYDYEFRIQRHQKRQDTNFYSSINIFFMKTVFSKTFITQNVVVLLGLITMELMNI